MANFCSKCGSRLDVATGLCPNCNKSEIAAYANASAAVNTPPANSQPQAQNTTPIQNYSAAPAQKVASQKKPKKAKKPKKQRSKGAQIAVSIVLSICLFITSLLSIVIFSVRNAVKRENASKLVKNIDLVEVSKDFGAEKSIKSFYDFMNYKWDVEMDDDDLEKIIEKADMDEFIGKKVSSFTDDFFAGDPAELEITQSEIKHLLTDNSNVIERQLNCDLSDEDYDRIAFWFVKDESMIINSDDISSNYPALYYAARIGFSYITLAVLLLLSALIIFFMIRNSLPKAAKGTGIVLAILSVPAGIVAFMSGVTSGLWKTICGGSFIGIAVGNFFAVNGLAYAILLVLGIGLIVLGAVLGKKAKKNAAKA